PLDDRSWSELENLAKIRWLVLNNSVNGTTIAHFKNLNQLMLLSANDIVASTPILEVLKNGAPDLRRLSLANSNLTLSDARYLAAIPSLEVLNLADNGFEHNGTKHGAEALEQLSHLANLTALCIDAELIDGRAIDALKKFPRLKTLILANCAGSQDYLKRLQAKFPAARSKYSIIGNTGRATADGWFDPLTTDPDKEHLW
ncbi:MAG: hypothetical protein ACRD3W_20815, partial [Terriglobales bacterium]